MIGAHWFGKTGIKDRESVRYEYRSYIPSVVAFLGGVETSQDLILDCFVAPTKEKEEECMCSLFIVHFWDLFYNIQLPVILSPLSFWKDF